MKHFKSAGCGLLPPFAKTKLGITITCFTL